MKLTTTLWPILLMALFFLQFKASAQDFEQRRLQYFDSAAANPNSNAMVIEAYLGQPVTQQYLDNIYNVMLTRSTIDFAIVQLVRVLFLGNGAYDSQMLPQLSLFPYWINYGDTTRGYWSENHMIMWMSSDWLIHERTGRQIDATLDQRLRHYLQLKIDYGFYEFMSSTYAPYCLSGLLNLADFAEDEEIRTLAALASKRLLREMLLLTNDKGVFFPASGRNYPGKFLTPYGQNHSSLIYLLTGLGPAPSAASHGGAFLATTSIDLTDLETFWTSELDIIHPIGHTLQEGFVINQDLSQVDRVIFQWSSGAYFHPEVVSQTAQLLVDSNMWDHVDFAELQQLSGLPIELYPQASTELNVLSMSSLICGQDLAIFKNSGVTLSTIQDFWKGKIGFQQHPVVACVGTTAVYPASGPVFADWQERSPNNANEHLPYVEQSHNVALVMYRPQTVPALLPYDNKDVALFWQDTAFDEIVENGNWLIGRQDQSYVAVRRSCIGEINGVRACETSEPSMEGGGQTWVIIVGNDQMYQGFGNFQNLIAQSQFVEEWNILLQQCVSYDASITFDGNTVSYEWCEEEPNSISESFANQGVLSVFPNPATNRFSVNLDGLSAQAAITVLNTMGQQVYSQTFEGVSVASISTENWAAGLYHITIQTGDARAYGKLVKQ